MCGIVGTISSKSRAVSVDLDCMAHRGPDGEGSVARNNVWLGHRRLAIIDLSDAAAQPMHKSGCGHIVFNGEIYDFAEHKRQLAVSGIVCETRSDTEVLLRGLAARGVSFLSGLHGMYSLAWLEAEGRTLWLARDHAGMKPLYYWAGEQGVAFASEIRTLANAVRRLGGPVRLSLDAIAGFLAYGSVGEPACVLAGARAVEADTAIKIDVENARLVGQVNIHRVTHHPSILGDRGTASAIDAVRHAVHRHVVADTPVALFLSSGIDSGVLAIELARLDEPRPKAIHVTLGSRGTDDEPALVERLTRRIGIELETVPLAQWTRQLATVLDAYDQPSIDGINTYLVAAAARQLDFKVALSGVGADEVFGGYQHYRNPLLQIDRLPGRRLLGRVLGPAFTSSRDPRIRRIGLLLDGGRIGEPVARSWRRVFSDHTITRLLKGRGHGSSSTRQEALLAFERRTYLRDTLLRDTDVMGMAHGVEIRAPFLDPDVLEAADAIGERALLKRSRPPKWVLRRGWHDQLEPGSISRPKTGFTLNLGIWLKAEGRPLLEQARSELEKRTAIDRGALVAAWKGWQARLNGDHPAAWVPLFAMMQLNEQFRRWGDPA